MSDPIIPEPITQDVPIAAKVDIMLNPEHVALRFVDHAGNEIGLLGHGASVSGAICPSCQGTGDCDWCKGTGKVEDDE